MTIRDWLVKWFGDVFKKVSKKVPVIPDIVTPKPDVAPAACSCSLKDPLAVPLVPKLGSSDKEVDANLRQRWVDGAQDTCGGLPSDIRPLAIRPAGKTFGWKYPVTEGKISVRVNGDKMTISCGVYEGQSWHIIGGSDQEAPSNGSHPSTLSDWIAITPGKEGPRKHFAYFECRDIK